MGPVQPNETNIVISTLERLGSEVTSIYISNELSITSGTRSGHLNHKLTPNNMKIDKNSISEAVTFSQLT